MGSRSRRPHRNRPLPAVRLTPGFRLGLCSRSGERDFALDSVVQPDALDLDARGRLQLLAALEPTGLDRPAHGALDLALGSDSHPLEKFAHFDVEPVLVHNGLAVRWQQPPAPLLGASVLQRASRRLRPAPLSFGSSLLDSRFQAAVGVDSVLTGMGLSWP